MAFRILTNRDLSVDDLKNIVASSNGNELFHYEKIQLIALFIAYFSIWV